MIWFTGIYDGGDGERELVIDDQDIGDENLAEEKEEWEKSEHDIPE